MPVETITGTKLSVTYRVPKSAASIMISVLGEDAVLAGGNLEFYRRPDGHDDFVKLRKRDAGAFTFTHIVLANAGELVVQVAPGDIIMATLASASSSPINCPISFSPRTV